MITLDRIRDGLAGYDPEIVDPTGLRQAAVAIVLRESPRAELLFIERALREGDPWSGHMAFPGGRMEARDPHERAAAERETREEVGLALSDAAEYIGRLDDLRGRHAGRPNNLVISAHVYHLAREATLRTNHEVREAFWFPVARLLEVDRHVPYAHPALRATSFPGIVVGDPERHVVWGLTYRFLEIFMRVVGSPLPARWEEQSPSSTR